MATGAAARYSRCLDVIFRHEGGYVDHPRDPGGATNMGITHRTLASHRGRPVTKADVRALTRAEAAEIYRRMYWGVVHGDHMPAGIDLVVFDPAVNSGPRRGAEWLQRALRDTGRRLSVDGAVGSETTRVAHEAATLGKSADVVKRACAIRMGFLRSLRTFDAFGRGWTRRVAEIEATGVRWALEAQPGVSVRTALDAESRAAAGSEDMARRSAQSAGVTAPVGGVGMDQVAQAPAWGTAGFVVIVVLIALAAAWRAHQHHERRRAYHAAAIGVAP